LLIAAVPATAAQTGLVRVILLSMGRSGTNEVRDRRGDPAAEVQVTVVPGPRGRTIRKRFADARHLPKAGAIRGLAVAALAGFAAIALVGTHSRIADRARTEFRAPAQARVAPAYRDPVFRCLSVAIALHDPRFTHAEFDRAIACGQ
jgi:hypothetical protein